MFEKMENSRSRFLRIIFQDQNGPTTGAKCRSRSIFSQGGPRFPKNKAKKSKNDRKNPKFSKQIFERVGGAGPGPGPGPWSWARPGPMGLGLARAHGPGPGPGPMGLGPWARALFFGKNWTKNWGNHEIWFQMGLRNFISKNFHLDLLVKVWLSQKT